MIPATTPHSACCARKRAWRSIRSVRVTAGLMPQTRTPSACASAPTAEVKAISAALPAVPAM